MCVCARGTRWDVNACMCELYVYIHMYLCIYACYKCMCVHVYTCTRVCDKCMYVCMFKSSHTGWGRPMQVIFRKRDTSYRALLQKLTCNDKASYASPQPCIEWCTHTHTHTHTHTLHIISSVKSYAYMHSANKYLYVCVYLSYMPICLLRIRIFMYACIYVDSYLVLRLPPVSVVCICSMWYIMWYTDVHWCKDVGLRHPRTSVAYLVLRVPPVWGRFE